VELVLQRRKIIRVLLFHDMYFIELCVKMVVNILLFYLNLGVGITILIYCKFYSSEL